MITVKYFCDGIETYLSSESQKQLHDLTNAGLDKDLAFEVLSQTTPEEDLYDLPAKKEQSEIVWIK